MKTSLFHKHEWQEYFTGDHVFQKGKREILLFSGVTFKCARCGKFKFKFTQKGGENK